MDVAALPPSAVSPSLSARTREDKSTAQPPDDKKTTAGSADKTQTDPQQQAHILELQKTDREVRAHEAAHVAAGGPYVRGGASFQFTTGPDGHLYATGGEVSIDTSAVSNDPEATIQKMQTVERAALAPAQPSPQDNAVAASAAQEEAQARMDLMQSKLADTGEGKSTPPGSLINDYA